MDAAEQLAKLKDHSCYVQNCEKKGLCVILIKGFISGILTGKTRTAAIAASEIPSLSTETEYCKPPPKPKKKPSKQSSGGGSARSSTPKSGPGGGSDFIVTITNDNWQEIIYGNN